MSISANIVIDHLGGTSKVAKLLHAPVSTVHSWRTNGIPTSRMAHLRLIAEKEGIDLPLLASTEVEQARHACASTTDLAPASTGQAGQMSGEVA